MVILLNKVYYSRLMIDSQPVLSVKKRRWSVGDASLVRIVIASILDKPLFAI